MANKIRISDLPASADYGGQLPALDSTGANVRVPFAAPLGGVLRGTFPNASFAPSATLPCPYPLVFTHGGFSFAMYRGDSTISVEIPVLDAVESDITALDGRMDSAEGRLGAVEANLDDEVTRATAAEVAISETVAELPTKDFVNSSITAMAANRVTYDAAGSGFPTAAALLAATTFYFGGAPYTPSNHDYVNINADETAPAPYTGGQTRWEFDGRMWSYAFGINERPFTAAETAALTSGITAAKVAQIDAKAPLVSPALTGTPTAPTASATTNSTQIATTAFVQALKANPSASAPSMDGAASVGTSALFARGDHRHPSDTAKLSVTEAIKYPSFYAANFSTADATTRTVIFSARSADGTPSNSDSYPIPSATQSVAGWMSAADKKKLDSLETPVAEIVLKDFPFNGAGVLATTVDGYAGYAPSNTGASTVIFSANVIASDAEGILVLPDDDAYNYRELRVIGAYDPTVTGIPVRVRAENANLLLAFDNGTGFFSRLYPSECYFEGLFCAKFMRIPAGDAAAPNPNAPVWVKL